MTASISNKLLSLSIFLAPISSVFVMKRKCLVILCANLYFKIPTYIISSLSFKFIISVEYT